MAKESVKLAGMPQPFDHSEVGASSNSSRDDRPLFFRVCAILLHTRIHVDVSEVNHA